MRTQVTAYEIVRIGALVYKPILFDEFREMENKSMWYFFVVISGYIFWVLVFLF